jgi:hypothetical protein
MKTSEIETRDAGYFAAAAAINAQFRSHCEAINYSDKEKIIAERMKLGLGLCYYNRNIHINYRKKFIAVKIDKPEVKDRKNLRLLENDYETAGYTKTVTAQGIIYRIPKA